MVDQNHWISIPGKIARFSTDFLVQRKNFHFKRCASNRLSIPSCGKISSDFVEIPLSRPTTSSYATTQAFSSAIAKYTVSRKLVDFAVSRIEIQSTASKDMPLGIKICFKSLIVQLFESVHSSARNSAGEVDFDKAPVSKDPRSARENV